MIVWVPFVERGTWNDEANVPVPRATLLFTFVASKNMLKFPLAVSIVPLTRISWPTFPSIGETVNAVTAAWALGKKGETNAVKNRVTRRMTDNFLVFVELFKHVPSSSFPNGLNTC